MIDDSEEINQFLCQKIFGQDEWCDFTPSYSMENITLLLEKMKEYGWWCKIHTPFTKESKEYIAGFTPLGVTGWNGRSDFEVSHISLPYAISKAAMLALKYEEESA